MIIWDTETTGLLNPSQDVKSQPRIIDLAAIQLDPFTGEEVNRFETLIFPDCTLPAEITKITGYRDSDVADAPRFAAVLPHWAEFCLGERAWLAHNLEFDSGMLYWELVRLGLERAFPYPPVGVCTAVMFRARLSRVRLVDVYQAVLGKPLDQKHTAMADVEALVEVVRAERLYELGCP